MTEQKNFGFIVTRVTGVSPHIMNLSCCLSHIICTAMSVNFQTNFVVLVVWVVGAGFSQLVATLVRSTKLLYAGPG